MFTFLTEWEDEDGTLWAGPDIRANTWEEAEAAVEGTKYYVLGQLAFEIKAPLYYVYLLADFFTPND